MASCTVLGAPRWLEISCALIGAPALHVCVCVRRLFQVPDMDVNAAVDLLRKCIDELKTRFILNLTDFKLKLVDKDGVRDLTPDPTPPEINMGKLVDKQAPLAVLQDATASNQMAP